MHTSENRLTINTNGQSILRVPNINDNIITYDEKPRQHVSLELENEMLIVKKYGDINLCIKHVVDELINVEIDINMTGNHFKHTVTIITKELIINDDEIIVVFTSDGQKNTISYTMEGIKCILQK